MAQRAGVTGCAAQGDGGFSDAEGAQHVELARTELETSSRHRLQLDRHDVIGFSPPAHDAVHDRRHRAD